MASKPNTPNPHGNTAADNRNSDKVLSLADQINDTCLAQASNCGTRLALRLDPASPGDHFLIAERLGPSGFLRQVRLPRINGQTWADRVDIDLYGCPVIFGIDPVSGGTVVATISFSRWISAERVEFYTAFIEPDQADAVLAAMRLIGRAPKLTPFHEVNSAESVTRRMGRAAKGPACNSAISTPESLTPVVRLVEAPEEDEPMLPGLF